MIARIRPAREDELDQLGDLWGEMNEHQQAHGMILPLRDDAVAIWKNEQTNRLDTKLSVVLVAELDEPPLAGFLAASTKLLPAYFDTPNPRVGFISSLYVRPAARRHRVGHALVEASFAWFRAAEISSVELQVVIENDSAREFWTTMGFEPELLQMRALKL